MNSLRDFKQKAKGFSITPLGIVSLCVSLIYCLASLVVIFNLKSLQGPSERLPFIWFIIGFPVLLLVGLIYLAIKHKDNRYQPESYSDEDQFEETIERPSSKRNQYQEIRRREKENSFENNYRNSRKVNETEEVFPEIASQKITEEKVESIQPLENVGSIKKIKPEIVATNNIQKEETPAPVIEKVIAPIEETAPEIISSNIEEVKVEPITPLKEVVSVKEIAPEIVAINNIQKEEAPAPVIEKVIAPIEETTPEIISSNIEEVKVEPIVPIEKVASVKEIEPEIVATNNIQKEEAPAPVIEKVVAPIEETASEIVSSNIEEVKVEPIVPLEEVVSVKEIEPEIVATNNIQKEEASAPVIEKVVAPIEETLPDTVADTIKEVKEAHFQTWEEVVSAKGINQENFSTNNIQKEEAPASPIEVVIAPNEKTQPEIVSNIEEIKVEPIVPLEEVVSVKEIQPETFATNNIQEEEEAPIAQTEKYDAIDNIEEPSAFEETIPENISFNTLDEKFENTPEDFDINTLIEVYTNAEKWASQEIGLKYKIPFKTNITLATQIGKFELDAYCHSKENTYIAEIKYWQRHKGDKKLKLAINEIMDRHKRLRIAFGDENNFKIIIALVFDNIDGVDKNDLMDYVDRLDDGTILEFFDYQELKRNYEYRLQNQTALIN